MMMEAALHKNNSFASLTYAEDNLPPDNSLYPYDLVTWLKRFRKAIAPDRVRFFAVGEYGAGGRREWNPHYHVALFGFPPCVYGRSHFPKKGGSCCPFCDVVRDTWGLGHVVLGTLTFESASYTAQYVTKKMTAADDGRLQGRCPEFARMSLRPGIGAGYAAEAVRNLSEAAPVGPLSDVPSSMQWGSRIVPVDRYMRSKMRASLGRDEKTPAFALSEWQEKMQALRLRAERIASEKGNVSRAYEKKVFQEVLKAEHAGAANSKIARYKIKRSKRSL